MSSIKILKCIYKECITNTLPSKEKGILFCFPRKDSFRDQWLKNMNRMDLNDFSCQQLNDRGYRVCQLHFDDNQFQNKLKLKLNFNQVPRPVLNQDAENLIPEMEQLGKGAVIIADIGQPKKSTTTIDDANNLIPEMEQSGKGAVIIADIGQPRKSTTTIDGSPEQLTLKQLKVARQQNLAPRELLMYQRLRTTRRLLTLSRIWNRTRSGKFKRSQVASNRALNQVANICALPRILRSFILSVLQNFATNKKFRIYSVEETFLLLSIMKHNPHCYIFLQRLLGFPLLRSLKRLLANFKLYSGINDRLFEYLSSVSESLKTEDRYCVIMFGEMKLRKSLSMSVGKDAFSGDGFADTATGRESMLADHVLVFMIRGICKKWKQPIAFYFTHNSVDSLKLKALILQVVRAVHEKTKFHIVASVCDAGLRNVFALRNLTTDSGRDMNDFVYNIDGHEIIHLFDAPYLLKCMRNNFMAKNIIFKGKVARWSDIRMMYETDSVNRIKVTKLTNSHVNPSIRQKMKVKLAAEVFSFTIASSLSFLTNIGMVVAGGTVHFVKFMDDLFDSMNSVTVSSKPLACKVTRGSPHSQFWLKARRALSQMKFLVGDSQVCNPPFLQLLISTLRNMKYLWETLAHSGFEYLNTRALNQDPLENLFSVVRGLCGGNSRPSTTQFVDAYKTAILNNTVRCSIDSNCEDDGGNLLLSYQILSSDTSDPLD